MAFGDTEKSYCVDLLKVTEEISKILEASGEDLSRYRGLDKVHNIAKNADPDGMKKIERYLDGVVSAASDNRAYSKALRLKVEQAYYLADQLR